MHKLEAFTFMLLFELCRNVLCIVSQFSPAAAIQHNLVYSSYVLLLCHLLWM